MKSVKEKEQFVRLRAQGLSFRKIEEKLGITKKTLVSWEAELCEGIAKERAKEIEHLNESYWAEKRGRIEFLVEREKRLQEEERKRDLSDVPTAKLMQLELQTSELLKKEIRSLPTQIGHGALGPALPANASAAAERATPTGSTDEESASDPFAAYGHDDAYTLAHALLAEQTSLKAELFEIVGDAESESARIAAVKAIDAISRRMLEMLQSLGLTTTVSEEGQISAVLERWAGRDRREIMYGCMCNDLGAGHLTFEAHRAERRGDLEAAEALFAEFESRVREWERQQIRADIWALKSLLRKEAGAQGGNHPKRIVAATRTRDGTQRAQSAIFSDNGRSQLRYSRRSRRRRGSNTCLNHRLAKTRGSQVHYSCSS